MPKSNSERIIDNTTTITTNNTDLETLKTRINNLPTSGDTTATSNDILNGKTAVSKGIKVTGTLGTETKTVKSTTESQTITPTSGKLISEVTVSPLSLETKTVTPTTSQQTINPTTGKDGISQIIVNAVTNTIDNNIQAENIKKDIEILGVTGTLTAGTESAESKDVNFYDYDGTILYSYTKTEFLGLTELPENPSHTGLISQGWNWTLGDAQTFVTTYGKIDIGQMYITDDGKTRIYIRLEEGRLEPYLVFAIDGTATIDWGDNSTDTITGSSISTVKYTQHIYAGAGNYVITIDSENKIHLIGDASYGCKLLSKKQYSSNEDRPYQNAIYKVELGSNVTSIENYAFYYCCTLRNITIPSNVTSVGSRAFYYCTSIRNIIIPNNLTDIEDDAFRNCDSLNSIVLSNNITNIKSWTFMYDYALKNIIIPSSVTSIGNSALKNCFAVSNLIIPSSVTSIGDAAFQWCFGIAFYDFTAFTTVPTLGANVFGDIVSDCKIVVPDNLYESWIAASNWSNYTSYIIKASDYFTS